MISRDVSQQLAWRGPGAAADWNSSGVSSRKRVVQPPARKSGLVIRLSKKRDVRLHAADAELLQAAFHAAGGVDETQAVGRHLDQQRIVKRRDDRAGEGGAGVEADAQAAGRAIVAEPAIIGHEVVRRVLGRDAALEGEAVRRDRRPGRPGRSPDRTSGWPWAMRIWRLDDVVAGDLLGDGVLDLDARIDLDEVELAACRRRTGTRRCRRCRGRRPGRRRGRRRESRWRSAGSRFGAGAISTTF